MDDDKVWVVRGPDNRCDKVHADSFSVDHGDLVFFAGNGAMVQAFAQGRWHRVYEKVEEE